MTDTGFDSLPTPSLLLDRARLSRNAERMRARAADLGVVFRPHLKTAKSVDATRFVLGDKPGPATVSTLKEAEIFGAAGFTDLLYAVCISPQKLDRVARLRQSGIDLKISCRIWLYALERPHQAFHRLAPRHAIAQYAARRCDNGRTRL